MAGTFAQLSILSIILLAVIVILNMETSSDMLGLFKIAVPVLGALMLFTALRGGIKGILTHKELTAAGIATITLGITQWLGDIVIGGISLKIIGLAIAIGVLLVILFMALLQWKVE